ncbi:MULTISPECIES: amino acid adenylation domain-containing protein [unclassified Streptomyces]|uniref:non-ribosomal peptide synthetase n=1 Tax=unclassified Streptomyces TaxID=2593676 RepID=UPI00278C371F|nr:MULTISPECIES: amino acid adenylation domain-containing protein [unclassified Streptomyces]
MTQDLLAELHRRGIRLRLVDDRLDVVAPAGALTPELRTELKARRDELLTTLRGVPTEGVRPAVVPRPELRHEPFPLTDVQHAYWVGRRPAVELGGVATYLYTERERAGLDVDRLERALNRVIERHGMLRAVVLPDGRQRVLPETAPYRIAVDDLRGLPESERAARLAATRAAMDHQVLPTDRCPLFDIRASLLDGERTRLHIGLDIMVVDGFSMYVLFQEWQRFYEDPSWSPEPLELTFRDMVTAEEEAKDGAAHRKAEAYWREALPELPPAPALPLATQPAQVGRPVFRHRHGRLAAERWRTVKARARERGLTPSVVLMTAYAEVLRRWSQQPDFTVNLTLLNRPPVHPQVGAVIGDFTSTTLLAAPDRPGEPFAARARMLQERLLRDLEHSAYNGVRVLRERSRAEGGGPGAGMPVVFTAMILTGEGEDPSAGMEFFGELVHQISQTPQVWLDHQVTEEHGDLVYNWDAVEELFPEGLLDDMFAAFGRLVEALADAPGAWDALASPQLPAWQAELRREVNDTARDIPERTLYELVADAARRTPDATAVITESGEHTYGELLATAHRLARVLRRLGAERDTLVGVVLDKGFDQVAAVLAVAASGAAYLPVDPGWPAERRRMLLEQGRVRTVVTTGRPAPGGLPEGVRVLTVADEEVRAADPGPLEGGPAPRDLAYVIFTSGSTGRPKGVMIDHGAAANTVQDINSRFGVHAGDRVLGLSSLSFDLSVYDVFGVLAAGGAVVLPTPGREHDPAHWAELVRRHRVTLWNSVPALMQAWTESPAASSGGDGLRLVLLSGDWIPVPLPDAIRAVHPGARVVSLGGATEAAIWSVFHPIGEVPPEWSRIPYGRPLANQRLHVLHADLTPCPVWTPGEIFIGGVGLARGYWADPERSAERFVTHPGTGERLYRTGDLGRYLPNGDIDFLGRMDFQVKLNGYRIELGEIEATLRARPGVAEAFASVRTSPRTGRRQLVGHVVPEPGAAVDAAGLRAALEETLPSYMVPHHLLLVDRVPLSANGKVDRAALPDPWQEEDGEERAAPRDEMERLLLKLWSEVLGDQEFGVHDNFFELGGDSLHAVRILGLIHAELDIEQQAEDDLEMLFDHPTIAELAQALSSRIGP